MDYEGARDSYMQRNQPTSTQDTADLGAMDDNSVSAVYELSRDYLVPRSVGELARPGIVSATVYRGPIADCAAKEVTVATPGSPTQEETDALSLREASIRVNMLYDGRHRDAVIDPNVQSEYDALDAALNAMVTAGWMQFVDYTNTMNVFKDPQTWSQRDGFLGRSPAYAPAHVTEMRRRYPETAQRA